MMVNSWKMMLTPIDNCYLMVKSGYLMFSKQVVRVRWLLIMVSLSDNFSLPMARLLKLRQSRTVTIVKPSINYCHDQSLMTNRYPLIMMDEDSGEKFGWNHGRSEQGCGAMAGPETMRALLAHFGWAHSLRSRCGLTLWRENLVVYQPGHGPVTFPSINLADAQ